MSKRYKIWLKIRDYAEKALGEIYINQRGMNHACYRCNMWESSGNTILTTENKDESVHRRCENCGYEWDAVFTPVGFVRITGKV